MLIVYRNKQEKIRLSTIIQTQQLIHSFNRRLCGMFQITFTVNFFLQTTNGFLARFICNETQSEEDGSCFKETHDASSLLLLQRIWLFAGSEICSKISLLTIGKIIVENVKSF